MTDGLPSQRTAERGAGRGSRGRPWALPAMIALGVAGLMALAAGAVRVSGGSERGATDGGGGAGRPPELVITRMDLLPARGEVRERLRLLDPTPLFLPGAVAKGAAFASEGAELRPSGDVGADVPAALLFPAQGPGRNILRPAPPDTPTAAADRVMAERWFQGMARGDIEGGRATAADPLRVPGAGRMEVYRMGEAGRVASVDLPADGLLEASAWRPVELSVLINAAGAVAPPIVTRGSGTAEVDERVRALAGGELLPRLRLRPGGYRLVVGP